MTTSQNLLKKSKLKFRKNRGVEVHKEKMNGVQFTSFNENHELVLVLVHNFSMNGRLPFFSQLQERTKILGSL